MGQMSPLRRRMIEDMTVRNLSPATQRSYVHAVAKFSRYFGRSPERLGLEDVRAFQVHLVSTGISWAALNQAVCALRFFYGVTLDHGEIPERIPYAREPRKLPVVLFPGVTLPPILPQDAGLHALLWSAHVYLAFAFFALILLHVAAALFHALVRRDGVFEAMASGPARDGGAPPGRRAV